MQTSKSNFDKRAKQHIPQREPEQQARYDKRKPWQRTDKREQMQ